MKRRWSSLHRQIKTANGLIFLSRRQFMMTKRVLRSGQKKHYLMNWMEKVLLHLRNVINEGVRDISRKKVNWSEKDGKEQKFVLLMRYVVLPGCSIKGQQTTIEPDFINGNNFYLLFVLALLLGDDISFWRFARWGRGGPKLREGHWFSRYISTKLLSRPYGGINTLKAI